MKIVNQIFSVIEDVVYGIRTYITVAFSFLSIGLLIFFQDGFELFNENQQYLFLRINKVVLSMVIIFIVFDFIVCCIKAEGFPRVKFPFVKWGTELLCYVIFAWYGKTTEMPYTSLDVTTIMYFFVFLFVFEKVLAHRKVLFYAPKNSF